MAEFVVHSLYGRDGIRQGQWLYNWVAGIPPYPDAAGFDRVFIRLEFLAGLEWARASHETVRGLIPEGVEIPGPAAEAQGVLNAAWEPECAVYDVGSGRYTFTMSMDSVGPERPG